MPHVHWQTACTASAGKHFHLRAQSAEVQQLCAAAYLGNLLHTRLASHMGMYRLWQTQQLHALYSLQPATLQVFKSLAAVFKSLPTPCQHACTNRLDTMPDNTPGQHGLEAASHARSVRGLGLVNPAICQTHLVQLVQLGLHEVIVACLPRILIPAPRARASLLPGIPTELHTFTHAE